MLCSAAPAHVRAGGSACKPWAVAVLKTPTKSVLPLSGAPLEHGAKAAFTRSAHRRFRHPGARVSRRALLLPQCAALDTTSVQEFQRSADARNTSGRLEYGRRVPPGSLVFSTSLLGQSGRSARWRE